MMHELHFMEESNLYNRYAAECGDHTHLLALNTFMQAYVATISLLRPGLLQWQDSFVLFWIFTDNIMKIAESVTKGY